MDATPNLITQNIGQQPVGGRLSTEHLDAVIADWPTLGRPLLLHTEVELLSAFVDRHVAACPPAEAA